MSDSEAHNPPAGCVLHPGETEGGGSNRRGSAFRASYARWLAPRSPDRTAPRASTPSVRPPQNDVRRGRGLCAAAASAPTPAQPNRAPSARTLAGVGFEPCPREPDIHAGVNEKPTPSAAPPQRHGGRRERGARRAARAAKGALLFFSREDGARRQHRYRGEGSRSGPSERRISPPEACTGRARAPPRRGSSSRAPTRRRGIPRVQGKHPTHRARTCARAAPHPEPSRLLERPDHPPRARGAHRGAPRARQAARRRRAHEVARRARRMARCVPHAAPRAPHGGAVVSMWPSGQRGVGGRARGARRWRLTDAVRRGLNP